MAQCTCFVKALYGLSSNQPIEKARYERYCQRIALNSKFKTVSAALQCLPPTPAAMEQNIKRAHFQIATWLEAPNSAPPSLQPDDFGWEKDEVNHALDPIALPDKIVPR